MKFIKNVPSMQKQTQHIAYIAQCVRLIQMSTRSRECPHGAPCEREKPPLWRFYRFIGHLFPYCIETQQGRVWGRDLQKNKWRNCVFCVQPTLCSQFGNIVSKRRNPCNIRLFGLSNSRFLKNCFTPLTNEKLCVILYLPQKAVVFCRADPSFLRGRPSAQNDHSGMHTEDASKGGSTRQLNIFLSQKKRVPLSGDRNKGRYLLRQS